MKSDLNFDSYQFAGRRDYPVSTETEIDFSDYRRMHVQRNGGALRKERPFAMNDRQFQRVLLVKAWRFIHMRGPAPEKIDREEINRLATEKALRGHAIRKSAPDVQHKMLEDHKAAIRRAGGFLELWAAVAYRYWKLSMDSVAVAESLGITPWSVRQMIWRLRQVAKQLGFDVGPDGHRKGGTRGKKRKRNMKFNPAKAVALFKRGMAVPLIATRFGYRYGQGQNRTRRALRKAGVLQP